MTGNDLASVPRLVFGDIAGNAVAEAVDDVISTGKQAEDVVLRSPLESFGDPYPILRALWDRVLPNGTLTATYAVGGAFELSPNDVEILLRLASFQVVAGRKADGGREVVARRVARNTLPLSCTVVVPCRNELDNVANLIERTPIMGTATELLFVDGASTDGTPELVAQLIQANPGRAIRLLRQEGNRGKADATFQGFAEAAGDVVIILDADMTVRPEDLPRFYFALAEGVAGLANGTRMIFPMATGAMPGLNNAGNRFFSRYLSWLIGERITDTLCGTKAMLRRDIPALLESRQLFGGHDPWGDFDLLMGAAYLKLPIIDVPVRYEAREAGESKMRPLAHGMSLARTCIVGARRLKVGTSRRARPAQ